MAFRGTVDGVFHMQAVNEIYGRHPHSPLSWSGSHNPQPPHPDCSLPNMHAPSGMSHVHPNYLHSEHLPSRQTSQKQSKSGGGRKDSSGERGPGGQKRVARVFPRRKVKCFSRTFSFLTCFGILIRALAGRRGQAVNGHAGDFDEGYAASSLRHSSP